MDDRPAIYELGDGAVRVAYEGARQRNVTIVDGAKIVLLIGEKIEIELTVSPPKPVYTIFRAPSAARYTFENRRFVAQTAGLYLLHIALGGGWCRTIPIAAFPPAALDRVGFGPVAPKREHIPERHMRLRNIANDERATPARIAEALEEGDPCFGLSGSIIGEKTLNTQHYGGTFA